jgi:hypothetical protein
MYQFGSGNAVATPYGAAAAANPSPMQLGVLQETNINIAVSQKELMGKNQFPVAIARTTGKVDIKFKFANNYAKLWNDLFFGAAVSAGSELGVFDALLTAASSTITVAPPNSGTFARDLGVRNATTGAQMMLVASAPVAGKSYTRSGAVYTFAAGDAASQFYISYTYTSSSIGFKSNVTNAPMGAQPVFDLTVFNAQYANLNGSTNVLLRFPACVAAKLGLPYKNEDWLITEFDCSAFQDTSGNIMYINADE